MTSGVPWQVDGVRQQARETAREAARRSGMSVGEWLDSVINDRAKSEGVGPAGLPLEDDDDAADAAAGTNKRTPPGRHSYADYDDHRRRAPAEDIAEVKGRLDEVGRQLDQLSRLNASQAYLRPNLRPDEPPRELADVISRLDRRLDQLMTSGRFPNEDVGRRAGAVERAVAHLDHEPPPPAPSADPSTPLEQALMEIAERQRALDADGGPSATSSSRPDVLPRAPTQGLSGLEDQLRQVTTRIETLRPCGVNQAVETLRDDLAEIGLMLKEAMPRQSIEALEIEVRGLSERLHLNRQAEGTDAAIAGVERGLAEIRDALRALTPAENLVGVDETVRELSRKIDLIASNSQDPAAMEQLEGAIVGLRAIATQVASDGALAKLSDEVRGLAAKVDQIASSADLLSTLEHRISSMADALETRHQAGAAVPNDLDAVVKRLEGLASTRSDQVAVGQLEDRITNLVEKLDTSNDRLKHLETIESALSDLLILLERQSDVERPAAAPSPEVTSLRQDVQDTRNSLETVQGALEQLIDRLGMIENDVRSASPVPAIGMQGIPPAAEVPAARPPVAPAAVPAASPVAPGRAVIAAPTGSPAAPAGRAAERSPAPPAQHEHRPIDPNLPPDHPLEPGAMRARTGNSPVDRIAASEAALGPAKPPAGPDPGSKSNFIAAARRAAQAANSESGARKDVPAQASTSNNAPQGKAAGGWGGRVRSLLVAVSVVLIVLSSLHLVVGLFGSSDEGDGSRPQETQSSPQGDERTIAPETPGATTDGTQDPTVPSPKTPAAPAPGRQSLITPTEGGPSAASPMLGTTAVADEKDVTGSISRPVATIAAAPAMPATEAAPAPPPHGARATSIDKLPATIGGTLRAAAGKGDPAAEYEIAQRYAEGRGVPQNLAEAADWLEHAAKQGLAPAQFRLGGFYEKGFGVKKDLDAARRLYLAAAEAGNAKAMHNLAVLYAEGIDGKPDYQNAAKWFRKAADYGLSDSQYNLGVLYGRGIGMEPNLTEAYKWFTLAARDGDKESATKRDDVGGRMDQQSLAAAKLAAQAWTPLEQPEAATQAAIPAGGWDNVAAPPPSNPKPRNTGLKAERSIPLPVR
jgi:localization factor PodJL